MRIFLGVAQECPTSEGFIPGGEEGFEMIITHRINMDMSYQRIVPRVKVVQDDRYSRNLALALYEGGKPWLPGCDVMATVSYVKPDGTGGSYNVLPDQTPAWHIKNNVVTVALAPQVCTAAGRVQLVVNLLQGTAQISTFPIELNVCSHPNIQVTSENYYKLTGTVSTSGWTPNMMLGTDVDGNVVTVESVLLDDTLTQTGQAADAKTVGDQLAAIVKTVNGFAPDKSGNVEIEVGGVKTINGVSPDENGNVFMDIASIPVPDTAEVGQYLRVKAVNENGQVTALEAAEWRVATATCVYNGMELPALPAWDKAQYPYVLLRYITFGTIPDGYMVDVRFMSQPGVYTDTTTVPGVAVNGKYMRYIFANVVDVFQFIDCSHLPEGVAVPNTWFKYREYDNEDGIVIRSCLIWANHDIIYDADGTIHLAASTPIPATVQNALNTPFPIITLTTKFTIDGEPFKLNDTDTAAFEQIAAKRLPCQVLVDYALILGDALVAPTIFGHLCAYRIEQGADVYKCLDGSADLIIGKDGEDADGGWICMYSPKFS